MFENFLKDIEANSPDLVEVDLSNEGLSPDDAKRLADALRNNTHVVKLYLESNQFGDRGVIFLANMLRFNTIIEEIDLLENGITQAGIERMAKIFEFNFSLINLRFWRTSVDAEIASGVSCGQERSASISLYPRLVVADIYSGPKVIEAGILTYPKSASITDGDVQQGSRQKKDAKYSPRSFVSTGSIYLTDDLHLNSATKVYYPSNDITESLISVDNFIQAKLERNRRVRYEACVALSFMRNVFCKLKSNEAIHSLSLDMLHRIMQFVTPILNKLQLNAIKEFSEAPQNLKADITKTSFLQRACFFPMLPSAADLERIEQEGLAEVRKALEESGVELRF